MLYSYPSGGGMAGRVVPRRGYPASAWNEPVGGGMNDINARLRNYYHMNLGESVGFFGEGSSKIINTAILGEVKLEFVLLLKLQLVLLVQLLQLEISTLIQPTN